jgi:transcriptional regulator with XRE-family HTH domain
MPNTHKFGPVRKGRIRLKNLKRSRLAKGLSRFELAKKAGKGVTAITIGSAEYGFATDLIQAQAIAAALDVKLTSLQS